MVNVGIEVRKFRRRETLKTAEWFSSTTDAGTEAVATNKHLRKGRSQRKLGRACETRDILHLEKTVPDCRQTTALKCMEVEEGLNGYTGSLVG